MAGFSKREEDVLFSKGSVDSNPNYGIRYFSDIVNVIPTQFNNVKLILLQEEKL